MSQAQTIQEFSSPLSPVERSTLTALGYQVDYNNAARVVVSTGLGQIPGVGFVLSALVNIFWPSSKQDVWGEIKEKVEALIDEKISQLVYQNVQESLEGLKNNVDDYLWAVKNAQTKTYISEKYNVAQGNFLQSLPHFQSKGYEVLLLPLFAQFANLYLSLLRDGILYGADWGWSEEIQQHNREQIIKTINDYSTYTDSTYSKGLDDVKKKAPSNKHKTEPFNTVNNYVRQMTLTVMDFRNMWKYYDPVEYPKPVKVFLDREIYSDAVGTADNSTFSIPPAPTKPITKITVWAWDRIDACKLAYPQGGGPGGVTETARMGDKNGGSSSPPHGGVFDLGKKGDVVKVKARSGDILNAWWLTFADGSTSNKLGGNYPGGGDKTFSYADEILSSIKIMGVSNFYGSADCAVFGFKFKADASLPNAEVLQAAFVASPKRLNAEELVQLFAVKDQQQAVRQVENWASNYQWDHLRQAHWEALKKRLGD